MIRNQAGQSISASLVYKSGVNAGDPCTTGTTVVYITIDGGTQALGLGAVQHEGNGQWTYFPTTETDGAALAFLFLNSLAVAEGLEVYTTSVSAITYPSTTPGSSGIATCTGLQIVENALRKINVVGVGQTVPSDIAEHGRQALNMLLSIWKTKSIFVYAINHTAFPISTSKQSYTIGPSGADFTANRPAKIERANLLRTDGTRAALDVYDYRQYGRIYQPAQSAAEPLVIYYQPTIPSGTIWPVPYPTNTANSFELFTWAVLDLWFDLATAIVLPEGYEMALTLTLAEFLCADYEKKISDELARFAREARAAIASVNSRPPKIDTQGSFPQSESY